MDLFDQHRQAQTEAEAPLAERMRPRTLDEFVGQDAIVGRGRLLRRAMQADQLSSLIADLLSFYPKNDSRCHPKSPLLHATKALTSGLNWKQANYIVNWRIPQCLIPR